MKMKYLLLLVTVVLLLLACSNKSSNKSNGQMGYTIDQFESVDQQENGLAPILKRLVYRDQGVFRAFRVMNTTTRLFGWYDVGYDEVGNLFYMDGLSYANTTKAIEEDDWFFLKYSPEEEKYYIMYIDLNESTDNHPEWNRFM